jgi:1-acyl-sn-glycerol-3-phosphate acyltransferase
MGSVTGFEGRGSNPSMKPQVYVDPRPADFFTKYHDRVRARRPDWVYRAVRVVLTPPIMLLYRYRAIGVENVPAHGPVILAPNHFSFFDHFFIAVLLRREVHFMAKSQLFKPPVVDFIINHGGVFPVRRGQHDEEAFITAHTILGRGGVVLMYAEGGRSRTKKLGQPKSGIGRLVLESGVPVVPVAIHGSERMRETKRGALPKVTVQFGEPIALGHVEHPDRDQSQAAAEEIFGHVRTMHEALSAQGRRGVLARLRRERRHGAPVTG